LPTNRAALSVATLCALSSIACRPTPQIAPAGGEPIWVDVNGLRLKITAYKSAQVSSHPTLIVVLHGDLLEGRGEPTYHYVFARRIASALDDVVVAALLRPGYTDQTGDQSSGSRGLATGDNYTPEVVDAIAQSIESLKTRFRPLATILTGHSGGAAITGDLIGRHPSEVNAALLVSCPCDVPAWRKHMATAQFRRVGPFSALFLLPVKSLSPMDLAGNISPSVRVRMVVGSQDPNTLPKFTYAYADALRKRGVDVSVTTAPGLGHNILLEPVVAKELVALIPAIAPRQLPSSQ